MKKTTAQIVLVLLLSVVGHAQSEVNSKVSLSKPYWLKYSLIFFHNYQPMISPNNIIFTNGAGDVDAYKGEILSRGTKVKIYSIREEKGLVKLTFRHWPVDYEFSTKFDVLLKNDSKKNFLKSLKLLFSEREVPKEYECAYVLKTKKQVIQCLGFPIEVTRKNDTEEYFYILEFVGPPNPFSGYDGFRVKLKRGKVIDVSGYI